MKKIILFSAILGLFASCSSDQNKKQEQANDLKKDSVVAPDPSYASTEKPFIENGLHEERYPNGIIKIKGEYAGGKRQGQWMSWYENGKQWSEGFYKKGVQDGPTIAWYENGQKRYEGQYKEGKEAGIWKFWDEKGTLSQEKDYDKK